MKLSLKTNWVIILLIALLAASLVWLTLTLRSWSVDVSTVFRQDSFFDGPSGFDRKQYFRVVDQHVVHYRLNGESYVVTNEIATDSFILKEMVREGSEWREKPKQ